MQCRRRKVDLDEVNHEETVLTIGHRVLLTVSVEGKENEYHEKSWDIRARVEGHCLKQLEHESEHEQLAVELVELVRVDEVLSHPLL